MNIGAANLATLVSGAALGFGLVYGLGEMVFRLAALLLVALTARSALGHGLGSLPSHIQTYFQVVWAWSEVHPAFALGIGLGAVCALGVRARLRQSHA